MDFTGKLPNIVAVPFNPNSVSPLMEHLTQAQKQFIAPNSFVPALAATSPFPMAQLYPMKVNSLLQPQMAMPLVPPFVAGVSPISPQSSRAHTLTLPPVSSLVSPSMPSVAALPNTAMPISLDADEKSLDDEGSPCAQDESSTTADESSVSHASLYSSMTLNPASTSSSEEDDKPDRFSDTECEMAAFLSSLAAALPPRDDKKRKKPHKVNLAKPDFDFAIKKRNVTKTGRPKEAHICPNCHVTESTLWRNCTVNGKSLYFCNACGLRYKKGKYCGLCYKVYYDADTNHRDWKQCSYCLNWTHKGCLHEQGQSAACDEAYPYTCTTCSSRDF